MAVVQSFLKIPALHALAPTQAEPPFVIVQVVVLLLFAAAATLALHAFRPEAAGALHTLTPQSG